jgi:hypothetical protein
MKIYIFFLLMVVSFTVSADCLYNGNLYPTGAIVGGLTCQVDGTWR